MPEACGWSSGLEQPRESHRTHRVELREYEGTRGHHEWAVYSEDRPLEFWLKLSGFEPNTALPSPARGGQAEGGM